MITTPSWQSALSNVITDPTELLRLLELDDSVLPSAQEAAKLFPLRVPYSFVARMRKGDINDPLLLQVLPLHLETENASGFTNDPVGDRAANKLPGLIHKYHGRVLVTPVGTCAINCRYCFRRAFPYAENNPGTAGWNKIFDYIAQDETIEEIIFSGGDPLVASDKLLKNLINRAEKISHVQRIRFHTRLPIVLPERITDEFIELCTSTRLQPIIMIHCNHPNEVDKNVTQTLKKITDAHIPLYNQAVLLKGINDNLETLIELQKKLFSLHVQPYYLNLLDKVTGAAHFAIPDEIALQLYEQLQARLSGYLVPILVREETGKPHKIWISTLLN